MFNFGELLIGPPIIILNGALVFWLANRILRDEPKARIASFSLMIGIVIGGFREPELLSDHAGLLIGQVLGLAILWLLFFKEQEPNPSARDK